MKIIINVDTTEGGGFCESFCNHLSEPTDVGRKYRICKLFGEIVYLHDRCTSCKEAEEKYLELCS